VAVKLPDYWIEDFCLQFCTLYIYRFLPLIHFFLKIRNKLLITIGWEYSTVEESVLCTLEAVGSISASKKIIYIYIYIYTHTHTHTHLISLCAPKWMTEIIFLQEEMLFPIKVETLKTQLQVLRFNNNLTLPSDKYIKESPIQNDMWVTLLPGLPHRTEVLWFCLNII
jgi:hypothetical protein